MQALSELPDLGEPARAACVSCREHSEGRWARGFSNAVRFVALRQDLMHCRTHLSASARDELLAMARDARDGAFLVASVLRELEPTAELVACLREITAHEPAARVLGEVFDRFAAEAGGLRLVAGGG